jgi:predicted cupin superfamily sugar epimerase
MSAHGGVPASEIPADHPRTCRDGEISGEGAQRLEALSALEVAVAQGGYFRETYRSPVQVETEAGSRPLSTAILYLLTDNEPSRIHRLRSDELWLFHAGMAAELVLLGPTTPEYQAVCLSSPQAFVPADRWMGARVMSEEEADWGIGRAPERRWTPDRRVNHELRWTLVSCVVTPGFEYADFELGDRDALLKKFPRAKREILALT